MKLWTGMVLGVLVLGMSGSAIGAEQPRELPPFDRMVVDGAFDIVVNAGQAQSVIVETEQSRLERIETRVVDGELRVSTIGHVFDRPAALWITVPVLERVVLRGASNISMDGISRGDLALVISGAGDARLIGDCGGLSVEIKGSGDVDAEYLVCETVEVSVVGAGDVVVYASEAVSVQVSGSGNVDVYGNPSRIQQMALGGAARIQVR